MKPSDKRKPGLGTRADADTYTTTARHLTPTNRGPVQLALFDEPDFFRKAMSGKVRPAPREPGITHYGCDCCRWSA